MGYWRSFIADRSSRPFYWHRKCNCLLYQETKDGLSRHLLGIFSRGDDIHLFHGASTLINREGRGSFESGCHLIETAL
jgi:hypothetical protein